MPGRRASRRPMLLVLAVALAGIPGSVRPSAKESESVPGSDELPALAQLRSEAARLFDNHQYSAAAALYQEGYREDREASRVRQLSPALMCLNGSAAAMLAQFQYRDALRSFLAARSIAESIGDREKAAAIAVDLASVYFGIGAPDDSGEYFLSFYRHLRSEGTANADGALRRAQIEMLQSGTWQAAPRHWSSYFITCRGYSRDRSGLH